LPAEWRSNLGTFLNATEKAMAAGLIAAAEAYMAPVRERLLEGYTSGAYTTGNAAGSVARSDFPVKTGDGMEMVVGSTQVDPPYPLYWEVGHINLFVQRGGGSVMGGYVRIPIWEPTMVEMREQLVGIVAAEIKAVDGAL
jgi:hypothetical protein